MKNNSQNNQYDSENIFYKIITKKISSKILYETNYSISFNDINPRAKTHVLSIPKGQYINYTDFIQHATKDEILNFFQDIEHIATNILMLKSYKLQTNNGAESGQEVFHFHIHILSD